MAKPLTIFMFGYWGWGNATRELIKAVDAAEKARGFEPPLFVDIRVHRKVRAAGFRDDSFERSVGKARHLWMPDLGNLSVLPEYRSNKIQIQLPKAANELLEVALDRAGHHQRLIYFCSCELPCGCHRYEVAKLLIKAAKKRGIALEVVEWPGGKPIEIKIDVPRAEVPKDRSSRLHLASARPLSKYAGLAVGSLVRVCGDDLERTVAVCPAMYAPNGWYLPILQNSRGKVIDGTVRESHRWRKDCGYLPLQTKRS